MDSQQFSDWLDRVCQTYPFVRRETIGRTVEGKRIEELMIGSSPRIVHLNAGMHANEWLTTVVVAHYIEQLLVKRPVWLDDVTLSVVAQVNGDGIDYVFREGNKHWKANGRGVDLNNQFPCGWEIEAMRKPKQPGARDFPGYRPLSEPEAAALVALCERRQFVALLSFHSQGEEFYWGYLGCEDEQFQHYVNHFEKMTGYKAVQYIDSHAGLRDWFIHRYRRLGLTIELGKGENPLPLEQLPRLIDVVAAFVEATVQYVIVCSVRET